LVFHPSRVADSPILARRGRARCYETETEGTGVFGYASVIDNATNDAYFVRGVKMLEADCP
jgi:hypothetical protein